MKSSNIMLLMNLFSNQHRNLPIVLLLIQFYEKKVRLFYLQGEKLNPIRVCITNLKVSRLNIYTSPKQLMAASHWPSILVNIFVIGGSLGGNSSSRSLRQGVKAWTSSPLSTSTTCKRGKKIGWRDWIADTYWLSQT